MTAVEPGPHTGAVAAGHRGGWRNLRSRRPGAGGLLVCAALLAILPAVVRRVGDADFWWHYRTGEWIVRHAALPAHELFTYTVSTHRWWAQEYGYQVGVYLLDRAGGLLAVALVLGAASWASFWLILARVREREHSAVVTAVAIVLAAGAGLAVWGPRAQVVDLFFVCLELWLIDRFLAERGRAVYAMPLLTVLWANLHGGVIFGPFLLGVVAAAVTIEAWRGHGPQRAFAAKRLWLLMLGGLVAMCCTPDGPALFSFIWSTQFSVAAGYFVREWQPPNFTHIDMRGLELMIVALLTGIAWRRLRLHDVVLLLVATALAIQSVRHISIFVAVTTPILAWEWSPLMPVIQSRLRRLRMPTPRRVAAATLAAAVLAGIAGAGVTARNFAAQAQATRANYPAETSQWLADHPSLGTHMFNEFGWGGYLAYRFYGVANRRVFVYGATGLVGDPLLVQYADVIHLASDWERILDAYGVDYVVFEPGQPLTSALDATGRWKVVHTDSVAVVYVRKADAAQARATRPLARRAAFAEERARCAPHARGCRGAR